MALILRDTFTGTVSATCLTDGTHKLDVGVGGITTQSWIALSGGGIYGIDGSGSAEETTEGTNDLLPGGEDNGDGVVAEAGVSDCNVSAIFSEDSTPAGKGWRILGRVTDRSNAITLSYTQGQLYLWKLEGGLYTLLGSTFHEPQVGDRITLHMKGGGLTATNTYQDIGTPETIIDTVVCDFNKTVTKHGLGHGYQQGKWSDFRVDGIEATILPTTENYNNVIAILDKNGFWTFKRGVFPGAMCVFKGQLIWGESNSPNFYCLNSETKSQPNPSTFIENGAIVDNPHYDDARVAGIVETKHFDIGAPEYWKEFVAADITYDGECFCTVYVDDAAVIRWRLKGAGVGRRTVSFPFPSSGKQFGERVHFVFNNGFPTATPINYINFQIYSIIIKGFIQEYREQDVVLNRSTVEETF